MKKSLLFIILFAMFINFNIISIFTMEQETPQNSIDILKENLKLSVSKIENELKKVNNNIIFDEKKTNEIFMNLRNIIKVQKDFFKEIKTNSKGINNIYSSKYKKEKDNFRIKEQLEGKDLQSAIKIVQNYTDNKVPINDFLQKEEKELSNIISEEVLNKIKNEKSTIDLIKIIRKYLNNLNVFFESFKHEELFTKVIEDFKDKASTLADDIELKNFFNNDQPFVQFLSIPQKEATFHMKGDIHGNKESVLEFIVDLINKKIIDDKLKIIDENAYLIFIGDFVDYGNEGIEVLIILSELFLANDFGKVILVRGNHEDIQMNGLANIKGSHTSLADEIINKNIQNDKEIPILSEMLDSFYKNLPCMVLIEHESTEKRFMCVHGGIFDKSLDINEFIAKSQKSLIDEKFFCENVTSDYARNTCWGDIEFGTYSSIKKSKRGGVLSSSKMVEDFMEEYNINAIFRGHQDTKAHLKLLPEKEVISIDKNGFLYIKDKEDMKFEVKLNKFDLQIKNKNLTFLSIFTLSSAGKVKEVDHNTYFSFPTNDEKKKEIVFTNTVNNSALPSIIKTKLQNITKTEKTQSSIELQEHQYKIPYQENNDSYEKDNDFNDKEDNYYNIESTIVVEESDNEKHNHNPLDGKKKDKKEDAKINEYHLATQSSTMSNEIEDENNNIALIFKNMVSKISLNEDDINFLKNLNIEDMDESIEDLFNNNKNENLEMLNDELLGTVICGNTNKKQKINTGDIDTRKKIKKEKNTGKKPTGKKPKKKKPTGIDYNDFQSQEFYY